MDGAVVFVVSESAIGFGAFSFGDFQMVAQLDRGDAERLVITLDASFDVGFQIV